MVKYKANIFSSILTRLSLSKRTDYNVGYVDTTVLEFTDTR